MMRKKWSVRTKNAAVALLFLCAYTVGAIAPFIVVETAAAAGIQCVNDTAGANDEPGQKDLTKLCVNYDNVPTTVYTEFNWDETGTNGANTMDACNLFDTDGDGFINYAVCLTTKNNPAQLQFYKTYSCGDTKIDRCTTPATEISSGTTVCTVSQSTDDPFAAGTSYPSDTKGTCTIQLSTVGGSNAKLIDVCSFPSNQPNSDPSDCVIARPNSAKLEVVKELEPDTDSGRFDLKINGTTYASNVGDGGTTGTQVVTVDNQHTTQTILEQANSTTNPTSLSNYSTTVVCKDQHGTGQVVGSSSPTGATTRQLTVTIAAESDVVCTFTNTRQTGTVTLIKSVINDNGGLLGANDFGLRIGGAPATSGQAVSLPANTPVAINEAGADGYSFVSITGAGCPAVLGGTVTPVNGQNITCTITNDDKPAKLIVKKVVNNNNGGLKVASDFKFQVNNGTETAFEADGENELTLNAGTYSVTEVADSQYTTTYDNCTNVNIPLGGTATCTITNDDKPATLKLTKTVVNDNGGLLSASDFPVFLNGQTSSWGEHTVDAGTYTVEETTKPGYTPSAWGGDCVTNQNGTSVSLLPGETKECTITNDDQPAQLSGVKYEVNSDGSTVQTLAGWTICLDTNANNVCDLGEATTVTGADGSYSFTGLNVGTYNLAETNNLGGTVDGWTQIFTPQAVMLGLGGNSTDNNFGNFENASISGTKFNDLNGSNGWENGEPTISGWEIKLTGTTDTQQPVSLTTSTNGSGKYSFEDLAPGKYTVCEDTSVAGWTQTYPTTNGGCYDVTVALSGYEYGDNNFGNQARGTLAVVKNVDDGFGGVTTDVSGWTWDYSGAYADDTNQVAGSSNAVVVPADTYTINENQQTNYHFTSVSCYKNNVELMVNQSESVDVSVGAGDAVVCTFVNTRNTANITVSKEVVNNNGGNANVSDFDLYVNKDQVTSGATNSFLTDETYEVTEVMNVSGYDQTSLTCWLANDPLKLALQMPFTLQYKQDVDCKIVNDDIAPKLTVYKVVDNGLTNLTKVPSDFTMEVDGTNVSDSSFPGDDSGTTVTLDAGNYEVDEASHDGYDMSTSGDCEDTIAVGEHKYCTITNTAIEDPQIHVVKSGPDQAHEGDVVTYTFVVTNPGNVPFPSVDVEDDIAGTATYVSGDSNVNSYLDPGEEWTYTAEHTIPDGQVDDVHNTVTACGSYGFVLTLQVQNGGFKTVCDDDDHTLDVLHPGIKVVKDGPANGQPGTTAKYTFTVTNTGDTPLAISKVMDDVAGLGVYVSGDENDNDLLDLDETWVYTASHVLQNVGSLTNTVEVCGYDPLELEVCDEDTHTTIVYVPQVLSENTVLEDTGSSLVLTLLTSSALLGFAAVTIRQDARRKGRAMSWARQPFVIPTE